MPKNGSESEFQKPNRTVPNYFSNSDKVGIPKKVGIPTFFGIPTFTLQGEMFFLCIGLSLHKIILQIQMVCLFFNVIILATCDD